MKTTLDVRFVLANVALVACLGAGANHRSEPGFDPLLPNTHERYAALDLESSDPDATGRCVLSAVGAGLPSDDGTGDQLAYLRIACERLAPADVWTNDYGNAGVTVVVRTASGERTWDWLFDREDKSLEVHAGSTFDDLDQRMVASETFAVGVRLSGGPVVLSGAGGVLGARLQAGKLKSAQPPQGTSNDRSLREASSIRLR